MFDRHVTEERQAICANICWASQNLLAEEKTEFHTCSLLLGHQGPHNYPCVSTHIGNTSKDQALALLMEKFTQMQQEPFSLNPEKTTPAQRVFWTDFLESLRLVSRELGAVTGGAPIYRKEASLAWLKVIFDNLPPETGLDQYVYGAALTERTQTMLKLCQDCFD